MPKLFESWQFWHAAKFYLGESFITKVWGKRNARTIRLYCQDPRFTEDRCRDPLQRLHTIFEELAAIGRQDIAEAAIKYLSSAIQDDDSHLISPPELKSTINAEVLADYQAVAALQAAIQAGADISEVKTLTEDAVAEIRRTACKYFLEYGDGDA